MVWTQHFLVRELRAHMLHSAVRKKKKKTEPEHMSNNPFTKPVWYDNREALKKRCLIGLQVYPFNPRTRMTLETGRMVLETDTLAFGDQTPFS